MSASTSSIWFWLKRVALIAKICGISHWSVGHVKNILYLINYLIKESIILFKFEKSIVIHWT